MRGLLVVVGYGLFFVSGLAMFVFWFSAMTHWLGWVGAILAILLTPGLVVFPIVFWIVEGVFPVLYFAIWAIGLLGGFIGGTAASDN